MGVQILPLQWILEFLEIVSREENHVQWMPGKNKNQAKKVKLEVLVYTNKQERKEATFAIPLLF